MYLFEEIMVGDHIFDELIALSFNLFRIQHHRFISHLVILVVL